MGKLIKRHYVLRYVPLLFGALTCTNMSTLATTNVVLADNATVGVSAAGTSPGDSIDITESNFGSQQFDALATNADVLPGFNTGLQGALTSTWAIPAKATTETASASTISTITTGGTYLGVWQPGVPSDLTSLTRYEQDAGKHAAIVMFWRAMGGSNSTLDTTWLRNIAARGSMPMITWCPANWDAGSDQSPYMLNNITRGGLDSYIHGWARKLAAYGNPVLLRWAHEMNGTWYSWGAQPSAYVAAWKHIHAVFTADGATNVKWVWSPNIDITWASTVFPQYYPGDAYVDWVGLDGYNKSQDGWRSFSSLFSSSYSAITSLTKKPLMIAETASSEPSTAQMQAGDSKAQWIRDAFATIPSLPRVKAVLWFNEDKTTQESCTCNWPIESTSSAQSAFAQAVAPSYFQSTWHG